MKKFISIFVCLVISAFSGTTVYASELPIVEVSDLLYSYEDMQEDLSELKERYPDRMETSVLGTTLDGREIVEVILGKKEASYHILIQATIHAREYMNSVLAMNQIEDYLRYYYERSYEGVPWSELYEDVCFHIIPMANPDGVAISQTGISGIQKEELRTQLLECYENDAANGRGQQSQEAYFVNWKSNARGVDLNRNFDRDWEEYIGTGYPSFEKYKGTSAASEIETQAILAVDEKYTLSCCIAYHSYGNIIYWDYGSTGEVLEADRKLAECVHSVTQYPLYSTVAAATDSAGCSDYFVLERGIPAVTIENGGVSCPLPIEEYYSIYTANQDLWPALALMYFER